jgi:hypothetical protein
MESFAADSPAVTALT